MPKLLKLSLVLIITIIIVGNFSVSVSKTQVSPKEVLSGFLTVQKSSLLATSPLPEPKVIKRIKVITTAYSSTPQETDNDPFITAAGTQVRDGIVANNKYPFGTKIRFPELYGDKIFVVEDRMNSRKGNYHFDIWFPNRSDALEFGAKRTYIEILEG